MINPFFLSLLTSLFTPEIKQDDQSLYFFPHIESCLEDSVLIYASIRSELDYPILLDTASFVFWKAGFSRTFPNASRDSGSSSAYWGFQEPISNIKKYELLPQAVFGKKISFPRSSFSEADFQDKSLIQMEIEIKYKPSSSANDSTLKLRGTLFKELNESCLKTSKSKPKKIEK
jgi:hypothetical protein